ncbi:MAG: lysylphosphatidylglycerol synthase transmembrane domain-containing protein [Candidatus Omnitrophota bacterium]
MKEYLLKIIGIIILVFILKDVDIRLVALNIKDCNLFLLIAAVILETSCIIPKAIKWQVILKALKIKASFFDSLRAYWSGLFFGAITPGKVGDISRVYFLSKHNPFIVRSIFSVVLDRLSDIVVLLLIGLAVSFFYLNEIKFLNFAILLTLAGLCLSATLMFLKRDFFYSLFMKLLYKFIPKERLWLKVNPNYEILKDIKPINYILVFMYLLLAWAIYFLAYWVLSKALFIEMPFLYLVGTVTVATIVSLIPISISGLGTRDAAVVFMLSKIGISKTSALSFSLMMFAIGMFIVSFGFIFYFQGQGRRALRVDG